MSGHPRITVSRPPCSRSSLPHANVTINACRLLPHSFHPYPSLKTEAVLFLWHFSYAYARLPLATTVSCAARTFLSPKRPATASTSLPLIVTNLDKNSKYYVLIRPTLCISINYPVHLCIRLNILSARNMGKTICLKIL